MKPIIIELTESQCQNLADFIEDNLFDVIRNDVEIDNFHWLIDVVDAYKKLTDNIQKSAHPCVGEGVEQ